MPFGGHMFGPTMMNLYMNPQYHTIFVVILLALVVWTLVWKGIALWNSARNHQTIWFVLMLIINTLGILEIIYLLFFRKNKNDTITTTTVTHTTVSSTPSSEPVVGSVIE
jgi:uncharacterized membrane protein